MSAGTIDIRGTAVTLAVIVVVLAVLFLLPGWCFYALLASGVALGTLEVLARTHPGDGLARGAGTLLALGHSATLWFFESNVRVLVPAQSLLAMSAMSIAVWRRGPSETVALRMMAIPFAPLWVGLLTYLALARRQMGADGASYALLTIAVAGLAGVAGSIVERAFARGPVLASSTWAPTLAGFALAITFGAAGAFALHALGLVSIPALHAALLGVAMAGAGELGRIGKALFVRTTGGATRGTGLLDRVDALLFASAVAYGYTRYLH
jgi:CDP-diglyceride synthetase